MKKKMLFSIFTSLLLLIFLAACGTTNLASYRAIRSTPVTKSTPMYVPPTLVLPTPTSEPVEGYLSSDSQHLLWIQWNENPPGNIQGIWHVVFYNPQKKMVKDFDAPFTGKLSDNSISINIHYPQFITISALGTLKGRNLHVTLSNNGRTIEAYGISQTTYKNLLWQFQISHA